MICGYCGIVDTTLGWFHWGPGRLDTAATAHALTGRRKTATRTSPLAERPNSDRSIRPRLGTNPEFLTRVKRS